MVKNIDSNILAAGGGSTNFNFKIYLQKLNYVKNRLDITPDKWYYTSSEKDKLSEAHNADTDKTFNTVKTYFKIPLDACSVGYNKFLVGIMDSSQQECEISDNFYIYDFYCMGDNGIDFEIEKLALEISSIPVDKSFTLFVDLQANLGQPNIDWSWSFVPTLTIENSGFVKNVPINFHLAKLKSTYISLSHDLKFTAQEYLNFCGSGNKLTLKIVTPFTDANPYNNEREITNIDIIGCPSGLDLVPKIITIGTKPYEYEISSSATTSIQIVFDILKIKSVSNPAFFNYTFFIADADTTDSNRFLVQKTDVYSFPDSLRKITNTFTVSSPDAFCGKDFLWLGVHINHDGAVTETSTSNNILWRRIKINCNSQSGIALTNFEMTGAINDGNNELTFNLDALSLEMLDKDVTANYSLFVVKEVDTSSVNPSIVDAAPLVK